jgi:hypothetical protein
MTINELTGMVNRVIQEDQENPTLFRPLVAIGHTKDLIDFETVDSFLSYLDKQRIAVTTLEKAYHKCKSQPRA